MPGRTPRHDLAGRTRNIVIVTIDGTRWQEIVRGSDQAVAKALGQEVPRLAPRALAPNLWHMVDEGVLLGAQDGGQMEGSAPRVSLPGYLELLTGAPTTCTGNDCRPVDRVTLLDELRDRLGLEPREVAVIASWELIERAAAYDPTAITISAGRHLGATRDGLRVTPCASELLDRAALGSPFPGVADYRPDRFTSHLALEYLAHARPRFLFVALGDTDEQAHRKSYRGYLEALIAADQFVGALRSLLTQLGEYGEETSVLVTTDHGRSSHFVDHGRHAPESGAVWLIAAGGAIPVRPALSPERRHLTQVPPTVRALLGIDEPRPQDALPELLPAQSGG
jgi:hypothetical protein